jgi:hypothetical protein
MVIIRFADQESKTKSARFHRQTLRRQEFWATGEVMAPETALAALPAESFHFTVEGPATYERLTSLRN